MQFAKGLLVVLWAYLLVVWFASSWVQDVCSRAGPRFAPTSVPVWFWGLWGATSVALVAALLAPRRRIRDGHCCKCGYDLTGNVSGMCPECGSAIP